MATPTPAGDAGRLTVTPVDATTWRAVAALEVTEDQRAYVAEPAHYLALCAYGGLWHPLAVRLGDQVIGFMMWAVDPDDGSCWLGGVLVDRRHQRRGHGRRAIEAALARLAAEGGHRRFALSFRPDNPARRLYRALGFEETGETVGDEVVARMTVDPSAS
jgi:diamine N-acetyltransferase